ncbi:UNVERIFIED_CONTAM: putative mitochondrial protein [Sesamum latifolium]|uniref:Mitochondrial protein n=1 Tax=Sesamum latifolium TaxID=2727402 RepID=A0AAW2XHU3_9LAMI
MFANFFWHSGSEAKIHWIAWRKLCKPKVEGGLGFRRLREFNEALLAKQAWRVALSPDTLLHAVLKQKYFPNSMFCDANLSHTPSFTWRSLLRSRELLVAGLRWRVGDVAQLITENKWNEELILAEFETCDANCILSIKLPESNLKDELVWHYEKRGRFSVRSAYLLSCELAHESSSAEKSRSWSFIWKACVPLNAQLFTWRLCNNGLATTANLQRRGVALTEGCPLCDTIEEDIKHVMLLCPLARQVWALANLQWGVISRYTGDSEDWVRGSFHSLDNREFEFFLLVCWSLWQHRNFKIF